MRKRNKKYTPKPVNPVAIYTTINLSKPVTDEQKATLHEEIDRALIAITLGNAGKYEFDVLASTVDLSMMMSQNLFERAYWDEINQARNAMIRCRERYGKTGRIALDGKGLNALKFVIEMHTEQLKQVTGAEVIAFMRKRDIEIRKGNFYRG